MIGSKQLILDAAEIVKGMSSGADITDGGFSNETNAVNLTYNPGVINGVPSMVDKSSGLTGEAIAYTPADVTGKNGFILATDGKISSIDTSQALTTSAALTGTFQAGTSDIVNFYPSGGLDKIYATSTTDVARMDTDLTNGDSTWWSVTLGKGTLNSGVRHPMLKAIGYTFLADGNVIHRIESNTAATANFFTLTAENQITAMGIDASTGQILITTTHGANYNGSVATGNRVFSLDGQSPVPAREVPVENMITGFRSVGGTTFITHPQSLGYWNGSGVSFLRKLKNVTLTANDLPYKHHLANTGNTLHVIDGNQILSYGEVLPGRKVFYYSLINEVGTLPNFSLVCPIGDNKIGVGFTTSKFYSFDTLGTGVGSFNSLKTLRYRFPRPAYIRSVNLEYGGSGVSNNDTARYLYYRTQYAASSGTLMSSLDNNSGGTVWETNDIIGVAENPVKWIQFIFSATTSPGLAKLTAFYDFAE